MANIGGDTLGAHGVNHGGTLAFGVKASMMAVGRKSMYSMGSTDSVEREVSHVRCSLGFPP